MTNKTEMLNLYISVLAIPILKINP